MFRNYLIVALGNRPVLDEVKAKQYQENSNGEDRQDIDTVIPIYTQHPHHTAGWKAAIATTNTTLPIANIHTQMRTLVLAVVPRPM